MPTHDEILNNFCRWLLESEWTREFFEFRVDFAEWLETVGGTAHAVRRKLDVQTKNLLFTFELEDFIAVERIDFGPLDDYLDYPGSGSGPDDREFLRAIERSVRSLHKVVDVVRGESLTIHDELNGGAPVTVEEHTASLTLEVGDVLITRVIRSDGIAKLSAGTLRAPNSNIRAFVEFRDETFWKLRNDLDEEEREDQDILQSLMRSRNDKIVRVMVGACVLSLLGEPFRRVVQPADSVHEPGTVSVAFAIRSDHATIGASLERSPDFKSIGESRWEWRPDQRSERAMVKALVRLEASLVIAEAESNTRSKAVRKRLSDLLAGQVGDPMPVDAAIGNVAE